MKALYLILLILFPLMSFAQEYAFEYNYYPAYGDLEKKSYKLLKGYTQKEFDRKPTSTEVEKTSYQINEAFAYLGIVAFHQRGERTAVRVRLRAIELAVRRFGPHFRMTDVHHCYAELAAPTVHRKSLRTNQLIKYSHLGRQEGLAVK